ncbi:MAG TPA: hypothetical protein VD814_00530 [Nocardioides sp.]|nr:hypothetical protein [Nocardioides sp.]
MVRRTVAAAIAASVVTVTVGSAIPAHAGDDEKIRRGGCSGAPTWKMKVKPDDGRLEVEAEVDSNVSGQTWHWRLTHNGSVSARGTRTTSGPSGSFDVERRMSNLSGTDVFRFRATHGSKVCRGRISW